MAKVPTAPDYLRHGSCSIFGISSVKESFRFQNYLTLEILDTSIKLSIIADESHWVA